MIYRLKVKQEVKKGKKKCEKIEVAVFKPTHASIRFFNNRAKEIVVVGDIHQDDKERNEHVSINFSWSIPFRDFNETTNTVFSSR